MKKDNKTRMMMQLYSMLLLACSFSFLFSSCEEKVDFSNKLYITQSKTTNNASVTLDNGEGNFDVTISSTYKMTQDIEVSLEIMDEQFLNEYNTKYKTEYQYIPKKAVTLSSSNVNIPNNAAVSKGVTVNVKKWDDYKRGADYAIPLKINTMKSGMPVVDGSDFIVLELAEKVVSPAAAIINEGFHMIEPECIFGPEMEELPYGTITIEGKIKLTKSFFVAGNWRSDVFNGFNLQIIVSPSGVMNVRFPDSSFIGEFGSISLNKWYHFAIVNDNGSITTYFDGEQQSTVSNGGPFNASKSFSIASYATGTGMVVDEFRIWKTVRTSRQIKKYPNMVDATHPDLLVYYRFDEGTGNIAKDAKGKHDLQIKNNGAVDWLQEETYP